VRTWPSGWPTNPTGPELGTVRLVSVNLASIFGLHRRWRAALVGHLAVSEIISVGPMERYSRALAAFGL